MPTPDRSMTFILFILRSGPDFQPLKHGDPAPSQRVRTLCRDPRPRGLTECTTWICLLSPGPAEELPCSWSWVEYPCSQACGSMPVHAALPCLQGWQMAAGMSPDSLGGGGASLLTPMTFTSQGLDQFVSLTNCRPTGFLPWALKHILLHLSPTGTHVLSLLQWGGPSRGDFGVALALLG